MPTPHTRFASFYDALKDRALLNSWSGSALRAAAPRWISRPYRLTGTGALLSGGRWNNLKLVPAVYFADSVDTLNAEAEAWANRYQWKVDELKPLTRISVRFELKSVLDLTAKTTLKKLGLSTGELTACDWKAEQDAGREALTQALGRAAFECLADGLVAPSARHPGGVTLVFFPSHWHDGWVVSTHDEGEIPLMHGL
jgi:RES domain-containing protein